MRTRTAKTAAKPARSARKPAAEPAAHGSAAERAYAELKRRILRNEMPIGRLFLEQELADSLRMSRTPVRETLIRLAQDGLIEVRPRHGMFVRPVSADDMREIYEVLTVLEAAAAGLLAARRPPASELTPLRRTVEEMEQALARDDLESWAEADERFHRLLVELCGNSRLRALVGTVLDQAHRVRLLTLRLRPKPVASNVDHAQVLTAVARGDVETAQRVHRAHREKAGRMLINILMRHGLTQF
jgi:DNA-binding GntR family transcriptional regulator